MYAVGSASTWTIESADAVGRAVYGASRYVSLALDAQGRPRIAFYGTRSSDEVLRYAQRDDTGVWCAHTIGSGSYYGRYNDLVFDSAGRPHISFRSGISSTDLSYAILSIP